MKTHSFTAGIAAVALGFIALPVQEAAGQTPEIRVLASNGVKAAMEELLPQYARSTGRRLAIQYNSSASLKQSIEAGEAFDVAIVTSELLDALIEDGKVRVDSRAGVARSGVGVGIRTGAPRPDIRTPDALKRALLDAKSISYAQDGASRIHIERMLDRLGIVQDMKPKTILEQGSTRSTARVAQGHADLVLTLVSEILPVRGIELLGPLPSSLQNYVSFAAGVSTKASDAEAAQALVGFLAGPAVAPVLHAKGLEARER